jgi:hypothetical protein
MFTDWPFGLKTVGVNWSIAGDCRDTYLDMQIGVWLFVVVKLRDCSPHPHDKDFYWPAVWSGVQGKGRDTITGEIGTLQYVYANKTIWTKLYLLIHSGRESYVGTLFFLRKVYQKQSSVFFGTTLAEP